MQKHELIKSGIPGFDTLAGGGIPRGSIIMLSGDTGCGKSTFATQFLARGARDYGEPSLYVSFDEHKERFFANMGNFDFGLEELERERLFVFLEYPAYELEQFVSQESAINQLIEEIGVERLVIDSVTSLLFLYEEGCIGKRHRVIKLIEKLREWDCTTLLIAEVSPTDHAKTEHGIEYLSDGLVYFYNTRVGDSRERAIEVIKMRGMHHKTKICPFRIGKNGITVHAEGHSFEHAHIK
ncbi:MAG: ATPase domain-containing protein [Candidatus Micrarchaeia archaeon]